MLFSSRTEREISSCAVKYHGDIENADKIAVVAPLADKKCLRHTNDFNRKKLDGTQF